MFAHPYFFTFTKVISSKISFFGYTGLSLPLWQNCLLEEGVIISRRALARQGDYEMMPVCACVSHADFSKTTTATDFL